VLYAAVGHEYKYNVQAQHNDSTVLVFGLDVYPPGMTIDTDSGLITWTPIAMDLGVHNISIHVSDGYHNVTARWTITVLDHPLNNPPLINSACQNLDAKHYHTGDTIKCSYSATDVDKDTLVWTITGSDGLSYNNGNLTWKPKTAGTYNIKFNVTDGKGGFDEKTVTIMIEPKKNSGMVMDNFKLGGIVAAIAVAVCVSAGLVLFMRRKKEKKEPV
jgi:hypothetical protein